MTKDKKELLNIINKLPETKEVRHLFKSTLRKYKKIQRNMIKKEIDANSEYSKDI